MSFGDDGDLTIEEIGQYFKITRARIREIEKKALRRLQQFAQAGEDKELQRSLKIIEDDPELRELIVILLAL